MVMPMFFCPHLPDEAVYCQLPLGACCQAPDQAADDDEAHVEDREGDDVGGEDCDD